MGGLAWPVSDAGASVAAYAFAFGAVLWVGAILFRLRGSEQQSGHLGSRSPVDPELAGLGRVGVGLILTSVFLAPATRRVASPPILAHLFTFTVGVARLT